MKTRNTILRTLAALVLPVLVAACSTSTTPIISTPFVPPAGAILKDTIHGPLHGILLKDSTYYMDADVIIPAGDTILMQEGVTLIVLCGPSYFPEIQMMGTFISMGTQAKPNYITVPASKRTYANLTAGLWGGIQCGAAPSGDLILHWTHIEFAGGAGNGLAGAATGQKYSIWFQNPTSNFIMEDSWLVGGVDDPVRVSGGKVSIFRNVFEAGAGGPQNTSGDGFNMKAGTTGDVAYNLFVGECTNGPKIANKGGGAIQANVNIYNNTIITGGWRFNGAGARAGSINIEDGGRGAVYNNLIVNCHTGFRLYNSPTAADTAHTYYDYQWNYAATAAIDSEFYTRDDANCVEKVQPHDIHGAVGANDPMFVNYNVKGIDLATYPLSFTFPVAWAAQDPAENVTNSSRFSDIASKNINYDFHLATNSPCVGKAFTGPAPVTIPMALCPAKSAANPYGASPKGLGADFGAYQMDGSGNLQ